MRQPKEILYAVEGLIIFIPFIIITLRFPSGGILTQSEHLTIFGGIWATFSRAAVFLEKVSEDKNEIPQWVAFLCSRLAAGVGLGLSFGAILILNEWYANPDNGMWEPLSTAPHQWGGSTDR